MSKTPVQPDWMEIESTMYGCWRCDGLLEEVYTEANRQDDDPIIACPSCGVHDADEDTAVPGNPFFKHRYGTGE